MLGWDSRGRLSLREHGAEPRHHMSISHERGHTCYFFEAW